MPSSIPDKTSLMVSLVGCLLLTTLFFYFLYMPNQRIIDQNCKQISELKQKIHLKSVSTKKLQVKIASFNTQNTHLNYFNRLHLAEAERIPYLLKNLTKEANALGIKFLSVDPQHPEKKELYQKYLFKVEVRASYPQMLRFLDCIENKLDLNIDSLTMSNTEHLNPARRIVEKSKKVSDQVTAKIYINSLEMLDDQLKKFNNLSQIKKFYLDPNLLPSPRLKETEQEILIAEAAKRNPFHPQLPKFFSANFSDNEPLTVKKDDKDLILSAIIDFQEERVAILGQDLVKNGDTLKNTQVGNRNVNMKVLNIGEDSVILGDGQKKYILNLPDNPVQFK